MGDDIIRYPAVQKAAHGLASAIVKATGNLAGEVGDACETYHTLMQDDLGRYEPGYEIEAVRVRLDATLAVIKAYIENQP